MQNDFQKRSPGPQPFPIPCPVQEKSISDPHFHSDSYEQPRHRLFVPEIKVLLCVSVYDYPYGYALMHILSYMV